MEFIDRKNKVFIQIIQKTIDSEISIQKIGNA